MILSRVANDEKLEILPKHWVRRIAQINLVRYQTLGSGIMGFLKNIKWLFVLGLIFLLNPAISHADPKHSRTCREYLGEVLSLAPDMNVKLPGGGPVEIREIMPRVFYLLFDSTAEAASTFLRFEQFYESPKFRHQVFSFNEFKAWYMERRGTKTFTYEQDWAGFNIPSSVLQPFYKGAFDPLSDRELWLLNMFRSFGPEDFYVIAGFKDNPRQPLEEIAVARHELAHSLFHFDRNYRQKIFQILSTENLFPLRIYLQNYHDAVFEDEVNAYLTDSSDRELMEKKGISMKPYLPLIEKLNGLFERHFFAWLERSNRRR